jgi:hypothetical protein
VALALALALRQSSPFAGGITEGMARNGLWDLNESCTSKGTKIKIPGFASWLEHKS